MVYTKAMKFDGTVKLHKKLIKAGKIYSEQWAVIYTDEASATQEIVYSTESKNMFNAVERQFKIDFPKCKIIEIQYW